MNWQHPNANMAFGTMVDGGYQAQSNSPTAEIKIANIQAEIDKLEHTLALIKQRKELRMQKLNGMNLNSYEMFAIDDEISSTNAAILQLQVHKRHIEFFNRQTDDNSPTPAAAMATPIGIQMCEKFSETKKKAKDERIGSGKGIGGGENGIKISDQWKLKRKIADRGHRAVLEQQKIGKKTKAQIPKLCWEIVEGIPNGVGKIEGKIQQFKWVENENDGQNYGTSENGFVLTRSCREFGKIKSVRSFLPVPHPSAESIAFYFEVEILNKATFASSIIIGYCDGHFPLDSARIGKEKNSIGFWSKKGLGINQGFRPFADGTKEKFKVGDIFGIGLVHPTENTSKIKCFATCNGELLELMYLPPKPNFVDLELFPAISLVEKYDSIRVNFGNEPWCFNPAQIILR